MQGQRYIACRPGSVANILARSGNARIPSHFVWPKTEIRLHEGPDPPEPLRITGLEGTSRIPPRLCRTKNGNPSLSEEPAPRRLSGIRLHDCLVQYPASFYGAKNRNRSWSKGPKDPAPPPERHKWPVSAFFGLPGLWVYSGGLPVALPETKKRRLPH